MVGMMVSDFSFPQLAFSSIMPPEHVSICTSTMNSRKSPSLAVMGSILEMRGGEAIPIYSLTTGAVPMQDCWPKLALACAHGRGYMKQVKSLGYLDARN